MNIFRNRIFWLPLVFATSLFAADKIFLLPEVRRVTEHWSRFEDFFYSSRERLYRLYVSEHRSERNRAGAANPADSGIVLIYGSSRSAPFPIASFAGAYPDALVYNFSAPSAAPSYYHYWNERLRQAASPRIRLAIVELDAGLFTRDALQPSLAYSYDAAFVWKHLDWRGDGAGFSFDTGETFFSRKAFALLKYPLVPGHIIENQRKLRSVQDGQVIVTSQLAIKDRLYAMMAESFEALRGGVPYPVPKVYQPAELAAHAKATAARYRPDDATRETQLYFLRLFLEDLAQDEAPVLIYWPVVVGALRPHLNRADVRAAVEAEILAIRARYPGARLELIDLNDSAAFDCRDFSDSYHLAGRCFPALTDELLQSFAKANRRAHNPPPVGGP